MRLSLFREPEVMNTFEIKMDMNKVAIADRVQTKQPLIFTN